MLIFFVSNLNGHATYKTGHVVVCKIIDGTKVTRKQLREAELKQIGVLRNGGDGELILKDLNIDFIKIGEGYMNNLSAYGKRKPDIKYNLISGNY